MNRKILIDAGHGGKDSGAIGKNGTKESDIVLKISTLLFRELTKRPEYFPEQTRDHDRFVKLSNRVQIEHLFQPDIFVSLHCNASVSQKPYDVQVYHYKGSIEGKKLANSCFKLLSDIDGDQSKWSRVIENSRFYVLRKTKCPSILIELDFLSNPGREALLNSPIFQAECAQCIATGIDHYFGKDVNDKRVLFKHFIC